MAFSAPATLKDKWPMPVKYGLTKKVVYQEMGDSVRTANGVDTSIMSSTNIDVVMDNLGGGLQKFAWLLRDDITIMSIDKVAIFPALALSVVPKVDDIIVMSDLTQWKVKGVCPDPADAHFELWIRPITSV